MEKQGFIGFGYQKVCDLPYITLHSRNPVKIPSAFVFTKNNPGLGYSTDGRSQDKMREYGEG